MDQQLLERYFLNQLGGTEQEQVAAWVKDPVNEATLKKLMEGQWQAIAENDDGKAINKEAIWRNVKASILQEEKLVVEQAPVVEIKSNKRKTFIAVAAAIVVLLGTFLVYQFASNKNTDNNLALYGNEVKTETNNTTSTKKIVLEDGSEVVLNPNASISYPNHFGADKREVSLTGNAFFEVAKNPAKPFLVYSNQIVTKVLGTSFTIKTDSASSNISVAVHTGRVQVFENAKEQTRASNGVIITPNQQTVYSIAHNSFQTSLVASPAQTKKAPAKYFDFNRQPVSLIAQRIQEVYGVELVMENEAINKCTFTADLEEESLFEKLDILCAAINASYEIAGTKILLKGKGCQ